MHDAVRGFCVASDLYFWLLFLIFAATIDKNLIPKNTNYDMNWRFTLYAMALAVGLGACTSDPTSGLPETKQTETASRSGETNTDLFIARNGETILTGAVYAPNDYTRYYNDPAVADHVCKLITVCDPSFAESLNGVSITSQQLREVAAFVRENIVRDMEEASEYDRMMAVLRWIRENITYDYGDQEAYTVFQTRRAVCQGYANLMTVMLHTQGIRATNANGFLANTGGHAWNYVLADGVWYVADPTNSNTVYRMVEDLDKYRSSLQPWTIDMPLHRDAGFLYDFRDKHFGIRTVINENESPVVSVPFGALGYRLTGFDPIGGIEGSVEEIYLSLNIQNVGSYVEGLKKEGGNLRAIYVWNEKNHVINDYDGCLYKVKHNVQEQTHTFTELLYVPGEKTEMRYAPMPVAVRKGIGDWENLEKIYFDATTLIFEDYAVDHCPNLKEVHINKDATVSADAFKGLPAGCRIIRYDALDTGIKPIRK